MDTVFENRTGVIRVPLMKGGEYISLKDKDKASYTIMNADGDIVGGINDESYPIKGEISELEIQIPMEATKIPEGKQSDSRFILVTYVLNGKENVIRKAFNVIKFVPYTVNESDVYAVLGVTEQHVSQESMDIFGNYLLLVEEIGPNFTEWLKSGDVKAVRANRAILLKTAISLRAAIMLGVPKTETDNVVSQTRFEFSVEDFDTLFKNMTDELSEIKAEISGESSDYEVAAFVLPALTDPFTGG